MAGCIFMRDIKSLPIYLSTVRVGPRYADNSRTNQGVQPTSTMVKYAE